MKNTDTNTTKVSGLPWIATFGYDTTTGALLSPNILGRFNSVYDQRCQIAANLKDYCDSDDRPTSDIDPQTWYNSGVPSFTGNEKTPYINKIGIQITAEAQDSDHTTYRTFWGCFTIHPYVELINIFSDGRENPFLENLKLR